MNTLQLQFLMSLFAGWVNRSQQDVIELFVIKFRPAKNLAPFGPLERSHHAASCHT